MLRMQYWVKAQRAFRLQDKTGFESTAFPVGQEILQCISQVTLYPGFSRCDLGAHLNELGAWHILQRFRTFLAWHACRVL